MLVKTVITCFSLALGAIALQDSNGITIRTAFAANQYKSGAVMEMIMAHKKSDWTHLTTIGALNASQYPDLTESPVRCTSRGVAIAVPNEPLYTFRCRNIDLYDFKSHASLGSTLGFGASSWGWTAPRSGREFVAVAQQDGTAFAEISPAGRLIYLGRLGYASLPSWWREIRVFRDWVVVGSEAEGHGVQIFDMKKLLDVDPKFPVIFNSTDQTAHFNDLPVGKSHNMVISEEANHIYAVGSEPRSGVCSAGLIAINMTDPSNPTPSGCAADGGYVHDAQCLIYRGPDTKYVGREVCYGFNELYMVIYDMSNRTNPEVISKSTYDGVAYCHQGWVLDKNDQRWLLMDDEYDEVIKSSTFKPATRPTTYIWNITSLAQPVLTGHFKGLVNSIDHNQYVFNGLSYQSNYASGLRVMDVRSIPTDPTGNGVKEIGMFDVYPDDDHEPGGGNITFKGTWSSYGGFKSGFIFVNTIERGGYVVKIRDMPA